MIELILETDNLILELNDFTLTVNKLGLLALEVHGLAVNELIEVVNPGELLANIVLKGPSLSSKVIGFLGLQFILVVEFIDFLSILSVSFSQVLKLLFQMFLLRLQLRAKILVLGKVAPQSGNLCVSRVENILLGIKLSVEISILLLSVNEEILLIIDFLSEGRNHIDINLNSTLVVILHSSLLISYSVEVLFEGKKLVLKQLVFTLSLTQFHGLGSELSDQSILMVLSNGSVG